MVSNISNTTVINKTILYNDTVLPLNEFGKNLKITSISNVEEFSLEICLKTIFESNQHAIFPIIQYSKDSKTVYFYTESEISKKSWEEYKANTYKHSAQILEDVKKLLITDDNKDFDCISLYDVAELMKKVYHTYKNVESRYNKLFNYMVKSHFGSSSNFIICDFDYDKNELHASFNYIGDLYEDIVFSKKDGYLYIFKSESCWSKEVFDVLGFELSKFYDEMMNFSVCKKEKNYGLSSVNSNFLADISFYGVGIFPNLSTKSFKNDFGMFSYSYCDTYKYDCNSRTVISAFEGKESAIFKNIFVKISDCPKWCQPFLGKIRQDQLAEVNRQKRSELIKKIFPFL